MQERREDTHFELSHFRKHKRKTNKKQPGKKIKQMFDKPEDKTVPGKDLTNTVVGALGKVSEFASSSKPKQVRFLNRALDVLRALCCVAVMVRRHCIGSLWPDCLWSLHGNFEPRRALIVICFLLRE